VIKICRTFIFIVNVLRWYRYNNITAYSQYRRIISAIA